MRQRAFLVLVLGAVLIGLVPIGVRLCTLAPLAVGFWRFALALPVLWWWSRASPPSPQGPTPSRNRPLLVLAGVLFACDIGCFFIAIRTTTVANATLLSNCAPVFVAIGLAATRRGLPSHLALLATGIALGGIVLLVGPRLEAGHGFGDALGLISAVFYGGYQLVVTALRRDHPALRVMRWVAGAGALALGLACLVAGVPWWPTRAADWAILGGLALLTQIGGQGAITWAMAHLPPMCSSLVLLVQPVVAAALAWWLFADGAMGRWQVVGALLVLGGILLARAQQPK